MSGQGSISLVPEYGSSSSESDSDSDDKMQNYSSNSNNNSSGIQPQSTLGTKLSSILPPPKNNASISAENAPLLKRQATSGDSKGSKKIKIVVDLPRAEISKAESPNIDQRGKDNNSGLVKDSTGNIGSVFSDLLSMLPAPKNSGIAIRKPASEPMVQSIKEDTDTDIELSHRTPLQSMLVPHSLSKKQKGKAVDTNVLQKPSTVGDDVQPSLSKNKLSVDDIGDDNDDDNGDGSEHLGQKDDSVPFFTIDASEQGVNASKSAADIESESANRSVTASDQAGEVEMYYDPSSGYYYDHTSGLYYYYDTDSCRYIDARSLYQSESGEQIGSIHTEDKQSLESNIDKADIEKLIGRSAFKRGEANAMIGMAVRDLSHRSQLSGSDYSDSKAGAEFAAKRAAETRRRATHTVIEGESVDKKKKQKHNIMYLALQAQEQESNLKEAHANRKSARKAARSKYGL